MIAYRFLTDDDTAAFAHKVTEALAQGWQLHGSPAFTYHPLTGRMFCGQAVTMQVAADYSPDLDLAAL